MAWLGEALLLTAPSAILTVRVSENVVSDLWIECATIDSIGF
jgi:hypothetical protein